jgi:hypothetical protein
MLRIDQLCAGGTPGVFRQLDAALHVFRSSRERQSIHDLAPGLLLVHGGAGFGAAA